jgi:hypothetical protein
MSEYLSDQHLSDQHLSEQHLSEHLDAITNALDGTDVHNERLRSYVTNVTLTALSELGALRDECNVLMHSVQDVQDTLLHQISAYVRLAKALIDTKTIMADALGNINTQFKNLPIAPTHTHPQPHPHTLPYASSLNGGKTRS